MEGVMESKRCALSAVFFSVIIFALFPGVLQAQEEGISSSTYFELQTSSSPEVKFVIRQSFEFPFLQGTHPLTGGNNIAAVLSAEVSPVSLNGIAEINWTPAAFFVLSGGGLAGSGWNMPLGYGIGLNIPHPDDDQALGPRRSQIDGNAFDGLIWNAWGAATLQFDLGAVLPGYWNHVLFMTRHEFRYAAYTRAGSGDSWIFENASRENRNGWMYNATYVIGYHMPLSPVLNTVAFMAESRRNLYNSADGDFWGENLSEWTFSSILNFSLNPRLDMALVVQMQTRRNHGAFNITDDMYFYRDLALLDDGGQRRLLFHRVALLFNYRLR